MHRITIDGDRGAFDCADGDTLLRAGLRAGLGLPYECNAGSCGECKFQLLAGELEPAGRDLPGLTQRDRERGRALACQAIPHSDCLVRMLPEGRYAPRVPPVRQAATLSGFGSVTGDIDWFEFQTTAPADFSPGQYALLRLPGMEGWRGFSMANLPNLDGVWRFMVRRVSGGEASRYLFGARRLGDKAELDGPFGMAYYRPGSAAVVCIVAGLGHRSGALHRPRGDPRTWNVVAWSSSMADERRPTSAPSHILVDLARTGLEIVHHGVVSDAAAAKGVNWSGSSGFVHEHVRRILDPALTGMDFYVAGPPPMVEAVNEVLATKFDTPRDRIHFDRFF